MFSKCAFRRLLSVWALAPGTPPVLASVKELAPLDGPIVAVVVDVEICDLLRKSEMRFCSRRDFSVPVKLA
uniref:Putative secreted protein n=1 Tax=Anopheles darlingi TaxID=43151 RepID=A0A2M4DPT9_ANODA